MILKQLWNGLLDLLYPPKCVFCHKVLTRQERDICNQCRRTLLVCSAEVGHNGCFRGIVAALWYEGTVQESILRFKFGGRTLYAQCYGQLMAAVCARLPMEEVDAVTWIPVSRQRLRQRGYDQARLLATALARELDKPLLSTLQKHRHTPPQSGISAPEARRANVLGVYRAKPAAVGKRLLLVDDIRTTGATANEAGRTLLAAGAEALWLVTLAAGRESKENEQVKPC